MTDVVQNRAARPKQLARPIVLVGMMGSGKTSVGHALSQLYQVPFVDSDEAIEEAAGATIEDIFARDGEAFFRDRETAVLRRLMAGRAGVISTGGGAWINPVNRKIIGASGVSVWLDAPADVLWARVAGRNGRPLLDTSNPEQSLRTILAQREPLYRLADLHVSSDFEVGVAQMTARVDAALQSCQGVWRTSHSDSDAGVA